MVNSAIEKIRQEIKANPKDKYINGIGEYLISICNNDDIAGKIMASEKTIKGSLEHMKNEAKKIKVGNMAMFTPEEGLEIIFKYFGIKLIDEPIINIKQDNIEKNNPSENVSLLDVL